MGSPAAKEPWLSVVGVVGNVLSQGPDGGHHAEFYVPYQQFPWVLSPENLLVRTAAKVKPESVSRAIVREVQRVDKDQPVVDIKTMEQIARESIAEQRMVMALLGAFAALALVLAALGIYSVLSYSVSQRKHEIGVRMALGADQGDVLHLVVRQGMFLALMGLAAGVALAFAATRLLSGLLYGVHPTDPTTFVGVSLLLAGVAFVACYIPARRATKVDPMVALRHE